MPIEQGSQYNHITPCNGYKCATTPCSSSKLSQYSLIITKPRLLSESIMYPQVGGLAFPEQKRKHQCPFSPILPPPRFLRICVCACVCVCVCVQITHQCVVIGASIDVYGAVHVPVEGRADFEPLDANSENFWAFWGWLP